MASAEIEIRQFLNSELGVEELFKKLVRRISDVSIPWEERRFYWYYLYNSGYLQEVWNLLKDNLEEKNRVPFDLFIEIVSKAKLSPPASVIESLLKGLKKQSALEDILTTFSFDKWDERLPQLREQLQTQLADKVAKVRSDLMEKFEFLQNERMTAQAAEVLAQIRRMYPDDPTIEQIDQNFKQQWARELVSARASMPEEIETREPKKVPVSKADAEMLKAFLAETEKLAPTAVTIAYDMAIAGWFFEEYAFAMAALDAATPSEAVDWLRAELLLASRRYVECLDHLIHLETAYSKNPETTFGVSYLRAVTLKKLGQHDQALEILRSIVHIRPQYRSAQSLLTEWDQSVRGR
jgi:tetratricopeptide (TPR) repeat protein